MVFDSQGWELSDFIHFLLLRHNKQESSTQSARSMSLHMLSKQQWNLTVWSYNRSDLLDRNIFGVPCRVKWEQGVFRTNWETSLRKWFGAMIIVEHLADIWPNLHVVPHFGIWRWKRVYAHVNSHASITDNCNCPLYDLKPSKMEKKWWPIIVNS